MIEGLRKHGEGARFQRQKGEGWVMRQCYRQEEEEEIRVAELGAAWYCEGNYTTQSVGKMVFIKT